MYRHVYMGHPALYSRPLLRSVPMHSKYLFVRCRLPVSVSRKFLTTSCKNTKTSHQINAPYYETLKYGRLPFNKHLFSLVRLEKTLQKKIKQVLRRQIARLVPESRP
jgi:hypothetical protein